MKNEINGLLERGEFKYIGTKSVPQNANILGGIFVLSIKQPDTAFEKYKARVIVQGHKDKEKKFITHVTKTVPHKNIKTLICGRSV